MKNQAILLGEKPSALSKVYSPELRQQMAEEFGLADGTFSSEDIKRAPEDFADTRFVFSTWGMPSFSESEIKRCFPSLHAVFYAAGTVQKFARPFLDCGVRVFSAWAANAVPVAQYTVAQILLANKGFYVSSRVMKEAGYRAASSVADAYPGNYGTFVGLLGAGMIGSRVAKSLVEIGLRVKVYDPFLADEKADALGVTKTSLEDLFATCSVVSNHLANNEKTRGMVTRALLSSLPRNATFLNTGRGAQVREDDLIRVLCERPDLTALLDVTDPEPPVEGSPFYVLPNCILTPHIAGSKNNETHRMAEYMVEECRRFVSGEPAKWEVTVRMLDTMA